MYIHPSSQVVETEEIGHYFSIDNNKSKTFYEVKDDWRKMIFPSKKMIPISVMQLKQSEIFFFLNKLNMQLSMQLNWVTNSRFHNFRVKVSVEKCLASLWDTVVPHDINLTIFRSRIHLFLPLFTNPPRKSYYSIHIFLWFIGVADT